MRPANDCGCDACEQYGADVLDGEFAAAPAPATRPDPNRPRTTPFNEALFRYMLSVGERGEARRAKREAYFRAQDAVPRHMLEMLIAKAERKRQAIQENRAGSAGAYARAA
jgi:hypothetical protein